ncbi:stage III sporulation protein AF [Bacillus andreraoultii]|uniref:stage III sporulation protein AF n=1 Tax=Bacillus andreraoultii TaxID=1499685 RepID=UPI00053ADB96|nr:stage III sporulation protein AF [Bacillus andreraoultii]
MEFLTSWITNIILFILLAVIVELLLPQTGLQKYVKMVIGLLLIIIFLSPLLKLLSTDVDEVLKKTGIGIDQENISLENSIENKKIEIQAEQHAYILKQTAVQLEELTEKELMDKFHLQFKNIQLNLNSKRQSTTSMEDLFNNLESIEVSLKSKVETGENQTVTPVEEVSIHLGDDRNRESYTEDMKPIKHFLAEQWGVDESKLQITIERGNEGG